MATRHSQPRRASARSGAARPKAYGSIASVTLYDEQRDHFPPNSSREPNATRARRLAAAPCHRRRTPTMTDLDASARKLLALYRSDVRSLLEEHKFTTLE